MSKIKVSSILIALCYIALGLLFIVRPMNVESALCYVLAVAVAVFGLLYLVGYFIASASTEEGSNGFAIGILMLMMAVFIIVKQDLIITLVPFLFGVMVMIRGLFTIQTAFRIKRLGFPMGLTLIMGLVIMAFGLFIMLFPLETGEALFIIIGCGLMAAGISGIIEEILSLTMHRRREHEKERLKDMGPAVRTYDAEADEGDAVEEAAPKMIEEAAPEADVKATEAADAKTEKADVKATEAADAKIEKVAGIEAAGAAEAEKAEEPAPKTEA